MDKRTKNFPGTVKWLQLEDDITLFTSTTWIRNHLQSCTVSRSAAWLWPLSLWLHHAPVQARTSGTSPSKPCMGPRASLSRLMYVEVSRGPLPVGAGPPPEARLKGPALSAVFAACQTVCFTGFISAEGGLHMGSVFYCHWLSVKSRDHDSSDTL